MPIYEYRCNACEHQFDALQKMSDDPLEICPKCDKDSLVKLLSAPSFRLSGSGWYETDFKTSHDKKKNLSESPSVSQSNSGKNSMDKKAGDTSATNKSTGKKTSDKKRPDKAVTRS